MINLAIDGSLNFDTSIDTKGFSNGTKSISNSLGGLKSALGKVAVAAAAAFSVKQIIDFGKQAIETASDMAEVQNVVDTAFGNMSYKMEEFASNSIKQFGISKLAAKQTGSTFMAMASGMGLAVDNASDMAIALTGLSADMASFYNVSQEVASTALKSIFTGETETLKQFGIVMTDANLQAYALSQGINKSTQNMSQAEKVQLRYNYVMQQTSLAQGDFAKTQDSWANQTRILSEQWKEFGATVGNLLMSVFLPALKTLNNVLSQLISFANSAVNALANVFGIKLENSGGTGQLAGDTSQLADNSQQAADSYSDMADNAEKAQKANEKSLASFDKINKISDNTNKNSADTGATIPTGAGSLAGQTGSIKVKADVETSEAQKKIEDFLKKMKSSLSKLFEPMQKAWNTYGSGVVSSIKGAFNSIWELIKSIGKSFKDVWTNGTGEKIAGNILRIFTNINNIIKNIADNLKKAWTKDNLGTKLVQGLADVLNIVLTHIKNITKGLEEWSKGLDFTPLIKGLNSIVTAVKPFADAVGKGLETFFKEVLQPMAKWTIEDAIPTFLETLSDVIEGISSVLETAMPVIKDKLWDGFLKPIAKWTADVALKALKTLGKLIKKLCESVTETDVKVLIDLAGGIAGIYAAVKIKSALDSLPGKLTNLKNSIGGLITKLKEFSKTPVTAPKIPDTTVAAGTQGATVGTTFATKFTASVGAFLAGWSIGSVIHDKLNEACTNALGEDFDQLWADGMDTIVDAFRGAWVSVKEVFGGIGGWFSDRWTDIKKAFSGIKKWFFTTFSGAKNAVKTVFGNIGTWFTEKFTSAKNGIKQVFANIGSYFSARYKDIKNAFAGIKGWFVEKFTGAKNGIKEVFGNIGEWFLGIWKDIRNIFSNLKKNFKSWFSKGWDGITEAFIGVTKFFSGIWKSIKDVFKNIKNWFSKKFTDAWNAIKSVFVDENGKSIIGKFFSDIWDGITSVFKGFINGIISAVNWMTKQLNKISIKIPDKKWVPKSFRGATIGFDIPEIPKLAQGAVIPPNKEFLAVLGDQKRGTNIEAPLDTIKQAVLQALVMYGEAGNTGGKGSLTVNLNLDGKTISSKVIDNINDFIKRNGKSPIIA